MKAGLERIFALLVGIACFATAVCATAVCATAVHAMDPIPPVRVGLTGLDAKTGEPLWERWRHEDLPDEIKAEIPAEIFKGKPGFGRVIRPPQPELGLPCVSGEFSIHLDKIEKGYFPEEITLIRKKNDQEISRKTFPNSGICVNALGDHFYFISPDGSLQVFPIQLEEGMDPWEPIREEHLIELPRNDNEPVIRKLSPLRIFVDQEDVFIQTPPTLFCFEENGLEKWRIDISDFRGGGFYVSPPAIHYLKDAFFYQDGNQIAKIDRQSGERAWTTQVSGFWYSAQSSHLIVSEKANQVVTSATFFINSFPDSFRRALMNYGAPRAEDQLAGRKMPEREQNEFVAFVAELRALGSRAMQVELTEALDDPDRIPTEVRDEVEALLHSEWPEFRSEDRRRAYLIRGMKTPPDHAFDRIASWKAVFSEYWNHIFQLWIHLDGEDPDQVRRIWIPVYEFWPGTEEYVLAPDFPSLSTFAREMFESTDGVEKAFAAAILAKLAGKPEGLNREEALELESSGDIRLSTIGTFAWAWFADREAVLERIEELPAESSLALMLKQCLSLHPRGEPSSSEIEFWSEEARDLQGHYTTQDFVECFRIAHEGGFPPAFEEAIRKVLRPYLDDPKSLNLAKFEALCEFDNPEDDELIAAYAKLFRETHAQIDQVIAQREKRRSESR